MPPGTPVALSEDMVIEVIQQCKEVNLPYSTRSNPCTHVGAIQIMLRQPSLLELHCPVNVVGDIHGQYSDLLRLFEMGGFPGESNYLFLGDYVDRAQQGVEVMTMLMCYKIKYPEVRSEREGPKPMLTAFACHPDIFHASRKS